MRLLHSTGQSSDLKKLVFLASIVAGFFLFTANYRAEPGGYLFIMYADALAHGIQYLNVNVAQRDAGYPLLLWLSGYPYHHSLIVMALMNTMMAIAIPSLIYLTIKPALPKGAYYIALAAIVSLAPFYYMKWIHHDQAYVFFNVLSICLLSLFIDSKKSIYLYAMTAAVILGSLVRPAGNIMFPLFILLAFWFARGAVLRYVICIMMALCTLFVYNHHRQQFFAQYQPLSTSVGFQAFQNLYVNSKEYGILLSPEIGPAMKKITDNLYQAVLPEPASAKILKPEEARHEQFLKMYAYPYHANEFIEQIYAHPCIEYFRLLYAASGDDLLFLKASFEIIRQYPWYPFAYTARNIWHLLYKPGYTHARYTLGEYHKMGVQDAFPFDHESNELMHLSSRALRELTFDTFDHKPKVVWHIVHSMRFVFRNLYLISTQILSLLMAVAWVAVGANLLGFSKKLMPPKMVPLVIVVSLYLFQNLIIIGALVDPLLRFHNHLILFKILLAGCGVGVLIRLKRQFKATSSQTVAGENALAVEKATISIFWLLLGILILFVSWVIYILAHT